MVVHVIVAGGERVKGEKAVATFTLISQAHQ